MLLGEWGGLSQADVDRIVHEAMDAGVTAFDTAAMYGGGESEMLLGRALRGRRAESWISTKVFGPQRRAPEDWTLPALRQAIDSSLRRLGTDHVDVLSIHRLDDHMPVETVLCALSEAQAQGKARWIGSSSMSGDLLLEAIVAARLFSSSISFEQCKLSILDRTSEASILPVADRYAVRPTFYGVLEEGLLARQGSAGRFSRGVEVQPWPELARRSLEQKHAAARRLEAVASDLGMTLRDLAVSFACMPYSAGGHLIEPDVIVGVSRPGQIGSLVSAAQATLSPDVVHELDAIVPPGTAVGVPDRSRMRWAALTRRGQVPQPLVAGDPRRIPLDGS
jgi:aryl-alcohol dehydrogenase (NADP+)